MLNDRLDEWSARTGKSRADAAAALGVHLNHLGNWTRGVNRPRLRYLRALAALLNADPVEVLREIKAAQAARKSRSAAVDP